MIWEVKVNIGPGSKMGKMVNICPRVSRCLQETHHIRSLGEVMFSHALVSSPGGME